MISWSELRLQLRTGFYFRTWPYAALTDLKGGYREFGFSNGSNGVRDSNDSTWPIEGAYFEEIVTSKLPVDPWLPTTGLEQADRQPLLRQCV
jgi:hypothetical protein